jgi:hypothetical protein
VHGTHAPTTQNGAWAGQSSGPSQPEPVDVDSSAVPDVEVDVLVEPLLVEGVDEVDSVALVESSVPSVELSSVAGAESPQPTARRAKVMRRIIVGGCPRRPSQ